MPADGDPALADFPADAPGTRRWCFADQLGPHFLDAPDQPVLLVESRAVFRAPPVPPAEGAPAAVGAAAPGRRAGRPGGVPADRHLRRGAGPGAASRCRSARRPPGRPATSSCAGRACTVLAGPRLRDPPGRLRGAGPTGAARQRLLMEDFYRDCPAAARRPDGRRGAGRRPLEPRPRQPASRRRPTAGSTSPAPWWPVEDEIDEEVRADLDRWEADGDVSFVGDGRPAAVPGHPRRGAAAADGLPRPPAARVRAARGRDARRRPVAGALAAVGALNLGLLDPLEVVRRAERRLPRVGRGGRPPAAEQRRGLRPPGDGLARLHLAPLLAPRAATTGTATRWPRTRRCPDWLAELDADAVDAALPVRRAGRRAGRAAGCTTSRG